jgi:hypothetical protein
MNNKDNNKELEGEEMPVSIPFGWLCICFSLIPALVGFIQKKKEFLIIGLIIGVIGISLLVFGWVQGKIKDKNREK